MDTPQLLADLISTLNFLPRKKVTMHVTCLWRLSFCKASLLSCFHFGCEHRLHFLHKIPEQVFRFRSLGAMASQIWVPILAATFAVLLKERNVPASPSRSVNSSFLPNGRVLADLLVELGLDDLDRLRVLLQVADLHRLTVVSSFVIFNLPCSCKPSKIVSTKLSEPICKLVSNSRARKILARTLRRRVGPNSFASLESALSCTTKTPFGSFPSHWPPQATHHQLHCFFLLFPLSVCYIETNLM